MHDTRNKDIITKVAAINGVNVKRISLVSRGNSCWCSKTTIVAQYIPLSKLNSRSHAYCRTRSRSEESPCRFYGQFFSMVSNCPAEARGFRVNLLVWTRSQTLQRSRDSEVVPPRQRGVCVTPHRWQRFTTSLSSATGYLELKGSAFFLILSEWRGCLDGGRVLLAVAGHDLERTTVFIALEILSARLAIVDNSPWQIFGVWFMNCIMSSVWASLFSVWASCRICSC